MSTLIVAPPVAEAVPDNDVRDHVLALWDVVEGSKNIMLTCLRFSKASVGGTRSLTDFKAILGYAVSWPTRRRRIPMNVEDMISKWVPIIRGLSTAHDKAPLDQCEFEMDRHLTPLLTAPVKQIRAFCTGLCAALEADKTIPFFVWAWFKSWEQVVIQKAPDGDIKSLKSKLAGEIAEMVEQQVQPDLKSAIVGALQWRSEESLERVKGAVEKGGKARMVGRESCLFLEVEVDGETVRVML